MYPIARGLAPVLVLLVGVAALGTGATRREAVGVCARRARDAARAAGSVASETSLGARSLLTIASSIAAYTLVDNRASAYANPIIYLELGMAAGGARRAPLVARSRPEGRGSASAARPIPALAGILSFAAYALVLAALQRAPAASVAAVRETSVLIVALLAGRTLGERVSPGRLAGAALVVVGVAFIVL